MKVKNLVLFGFVLSAISYLTKQLEEDELKDEIDLGDVDLEEIRKELGDRLENAVVEFGDIVSSIAQIGSDAFDRFVTKEEVVEEVKEEVAPLNSNDIQKHFEDVFASLKEETEEVEEPLFEEIVEEIVEEPLYEETAVQNNDLIEDLKEILESLDETVEEVETIVEEDEEEEELFQRIQEAILKSHEEEVVLKEDVKEASIQEIEDIFSEIIESEEVEDIKDEYIEELIDELESDYETEVETVKDIYDQINELYPYLSKGFVRSVYDLKESIALEYPYDRMVVVLHRIHFYSLEDLHQFVEIVTNHNYSVNVDENQMIVDLFKEYRNTDGKILTNIFEIANQAKLLRGDYEGYRVEVLDE